MDSKTQIEIDARKTAEEYWNCQGRCNSCGALINGTHPSIAFGAFGCSIAQNLDLVRRSFAVATQQTT